MTTTMMTTNCQALRAPSLRGSACALAVASLLAGCATTHLLWEPPAEAPPPPSSALP